MKKEELPLWEPFVSRGVPLSHLIGVSVWSPLTIVFGLIGYTQYLMQIQYIVLILLAAIFMYASLYNLVKKPWLCMVGGVSYATCGQFVSNAEHLTFLLPMVVFPLLHVAFVKWCDANSYSKIKWSILIGLSLGLLILNNYPPFLFVSVLFLAIEYIFRIKEMYKSNMIKTLLIHIGNLSIAFIVTCLVGWVSIYTTFEIISHITRQHLPWEMAAGSSLSYWYWLGFISPVFTQIIHSSRLDISISMTNVYISLPVLLLALSKKPNKKYDFFLIFIIIFSIVLNAGHYGYFYKILYHYLPSIDSFKFPAGFRYFYFYYLTLLGINNISHILNRDNLNELKLLKNTVRLVIVIFSFIIGFVMLLSLFKVNTMDIPRYTVTELCISLVIFLILLLILNTNQFNKIIIGLLACIVIFAFLGIERNKDFTIGTAERPNSYQKEIDSIYNSSGSIGLDNFFVSPTTNSTIFTRNFQTGGYVGSFELNNYKNAQEKSELPVEGDPVIFGVNNLLQINNTSKVGSPIVPSKIQYYPNKLSAEINLEEDGYIILQQTFFNGWKAKVNNIEAKIIETKNGVMAVQAKTGPNKVEFVFKPTITIVSAWVTFISWIILLVYGAYCAFIKYKLSRKLKYQGE